MLAYLAQTFATLAGSLYADEGWNKATVARIGIVATLKSIGTS